VGLTAHWNDLEPDLVHALIEVEQVTEQRSASFADPL
jgi:hypothetical protein